MRKFIAKMFGIKIEDANLTLMFVCIGTEPPCLQRFTQEEIRFLQTYATMEWSYSNERVYIINDIKFTETRVGK